VFQYREEHRQFLAVGGEVATRSTLMKEKALQILLFENDAGDARLLRETAQASRSPD
jgi:hypothetical protein